MSLGDEPLGLTVSVSACVAVAVAVVVVGNGINVVGVCDVPNDTSERFL